MKAYHVTSKDNLQSILSRGLIGGASKGFTEAGAWADEYYGCRPIYVSLTTDIDILYTCENGVVLEIDITGIQLYSDIPSLIDYGAYIHEGAVDFRDGAPKGFNDEDQYDYKELIFDMIPECLRLTKTAAILQNISPHRIKERK